MVTNIFSLYKNLEHLQGKSLFQKKSLPILKGLLDFGHFKNVLF